MPDGTVLPVISGLAVGVAFVMMVAILIAPLTVFASVKLKEEFGDKEGQQKAVDLLLSDPDVQAFVAGKNFEVWAYGSNFPQASLNEGICDRDECTLIGIRERNSDGSMDCPLKTFVNIETRQMDKVSYGGPCDRVPEITRVCNHQRLGV